MEYEIVIGLEIHAELKTKTKIFCGCKNEFGEEPNTNCCPVCLGMPGAMPALNQKALEYAIKAGLAMNCDIAEFSKFDRKNYFYPDTPKAYQISQYDLPLCHDGYIDIELEGTTKRIGIERIHLEEDAGKLIHDASGEGSLIDHNRSGVPLIEIVTRPDIRSPEEARTVFESIKSILEYTDVSDCRMQEGSVRADVNLSVRPKGKGTFGVRTEMKNINSFRAVERACRAEAERQTELLERGLEVVRETRRWDDLKGTSFPMRSKEEAMDYRFFPEPDLLPVVIDRSLIAEIKCSIPELPFDKRRRYTEQYGLPLYDAKLLTESKKISEIFETALEVCKNPKLVSNWIMTDLLRLVNEKGKSILDTALNGRIFGRILLYFDRGEISQASARTLMEVIAETGEEPDSVIDRLSLRVQRDENLVSGVVKTIIRDNPQAVSDYRAGKTKALGFLMGRTMAALKGNGDPEQVRSLLIKELDRTE